MFSKYEVYTTIQSIYCYRGTDVLKNKLGIKEYDLLKRAEEEITSVKLMEMLSNPIKGNLSKTQLFNIHKFLFGDIYYFAGKIRREQISKGSAMFYPCDSINLALNELFVNIKEKSRRVRSSCDIFDFFAYVMAELNLIHPFREGNGRAIREFIRVMALKYGYKINWGNIDRKEVLEASIKSVENYRFLIDVLRGCHEII